MLLEISILIIAIALVLLAIFAIPSLLQIWRTARSIEVSTEILNRDLPSILGNIDQISGDISQTSQRIRREVDSISSAGGKINDLVGDLSGLEDELKYSVILPLRDVVHTLGASVKAMNSFFHVLRSRS